MSGFFIYSILQVKLTGFTDGCRVQRKTGNKVFAWATGKTEMAFPEM